MSWKKYSWRVVRPGCIELEGTSIRIVRNETANSFDRFEVWKSQTLERGCFSLAEAKFLALKLYNDMEELGEITAPIKDASSCPESDFEVWNPGWEIRNPRWQVTNDTGRITSKNARSLCYSDFKVKPNCPRGNFGMNLHKIETQCPSCGSKGPLLDHFDHAICGNCGLNMYVLGNSITVWRPK